MMGSGVHSSTEDSCMRYSESSRHAPEIEGVTHYTECLIEYSLQMPFVNIRDIFFGSKNVLKGGIRFCHYGLRLCPCNKNG